MGLKHDPLAGATLCPVSAKARLTRSEAKSMAKRQRKRTINLRAYKCGACGGWHVGNLRRGLTA